MEFSRHFPTSIFSQEIKAESQVLQARFNNDKVFGDHKEIFERYRIDYNTIDPTRFSEIETVDGKLCVYGPQRVVCPPERYYLTLHRASLIGNKP